MCGNFRLFQASILGPLFSAIFDNILLKKNRRFLAKRLNYYLFFKMNFKSKSPTFSTLKKVIGHGTDVVQRLERELTPRVELWPLGTNFDSVQQDLIAYWAIL
jgi:hypothetical protein